MKNKLVLILLLAMSLMAITGCAPKESQGKNQPSQKEIKNEETSVDAKLEEEKATVEVAKEAGKSEKGQVAIDGLGREVVVPKDPQKILGLTSAATEALYNLGLEPVGVVAEYKVRPVKLPVVGKAQELNMEAIYALQPDLIIAHTRFHAKLLDELEGSGATVFFFDPDTIGDIALVDLRLYLGKILGREEEGQAYVENILKKSKVLKEKTKAAGIKTGVVMSVGETVKCAQSGSSFGSMLKLLGIKNIVPENLPNSSKGSFVKYDIEKIVQDNPNVIILKSASKKEEANKKMLKAFMNDKKWKALDAVKTNKVFVAPFKAYPNFSSPEDMLKMYAKLLPLD